MKFSVIAAIAVTIALSACRREVPYAPVYEPMKLGAAAGAPDHNGHTDAEASTAR